MGLYRLRTQLLTVTDEQLTLNVTPVIMLSGDYVRRALEHYSYYFITQTFEKCWTTFKELYWDNYVKQIIAQGTVYDPTKNYNYTETHTRTVDDGTTTKTRTPDNTQNYVETTNTVNTTRTVEAGTGVNAPKTDTYSITYDTDPKHTAYTVQSGKTTETNVTNGNGNTSKTVDNLKYTETTSHTAITKTIDDKTLSGDIIEHETTEKNGYLNANIAEQIRAYIDNYKESLIDEFITRFIDKYAFYVGGYNHDFDADVID